MRHQPVHPLPLFRVLVWLALAVSVGATTRAASENFWQLNFSYTARGFALEKAAPIPPTVKNVRTPGLEGAIVKLDYELEWLDAAGAVLGRGPVIVPVGTRVALTAEGDPRVHGSCLPDEGGFVLRVPGPLGAPAESVRLIKRPAGGPAAAALGQPLPPQQELPVAFAPVEQTFSLATAKALAAAAPPPAGPIGVRKVRDTGPDDNRVVIVMMGDGYTLTNLNAGSFSNKVESFINLMFGISPWDAYQNAANIYRVDIVSNQQGSDYEDNSPANGGTLKDTYLSSGFWVGDIERCCFLRADGATRAFAAADDLVGIGVWDEILVIVNSSKYGGCGGSVGVSSVNSSSDEVQVHEFGHSFAGLADEYDYGSSSTNCPGSLAVNADCGLNFPSVKWDAWVTPGTPLPTPDTSTYNSAVGAFEGAVYQAKGVFRPMRNCRMRSLSATFCPICKQQHIVKLFDQVSIADGAAPPFGNAGVPDGGARLFSVAAVNVGGMSYQWTLGGAELFGETNSSVTVASTEVPAPDTELRVIITHTNAMVRGPVIQDTYSWRLSLAALPSLTVSDVTLPDGDSGTSNALFTVVLSYAFAQEVRVGYATLDGTARAGADYTAVAGTLTFAPLQTTQTVVVPVLGDTLPEPSEVFFLQLSNPSNATIADAQGACLIEDDDSAPLIALSAPTNGMVFIAGNSVTLTVDANDADGHIALVEFFADGVKVGEDNFTPYSATWIPFTTGLHFLTAIALDNAGRTGTSAPVRVIVTPTAATRLVLLPATNAWRYDATTNDYGTAWKNPGYDDSTWDGPSNAVFYNESAALPEATNTWLTRTNNGVRLRSYYFRTQFNYPSNPTPGLTLTASNLVNDGAVFHLNGAELGRLRMAAGNIFRTSLATSTPPFNGDATSFEVLSFPATNLVAGDNLLAVEVHQQSDTSSDMVFAMSLTAESGQVPLIVDDTSLTNRVVQQGRATTLSIVAVGSPAASYQWFRGGLPISGAIGATYFISSMNSALVGSYFCRASNALGFADSRVAEVTYLADTQRPLVISAVRNLNFTNITVTFSEPLSSADVGTVANYAVTPITSGGALTVQKAALSQATNIVLTTSPADPGVNYLLTLGGVSDLWGNALLPDTAVPVASEVLLVAGDLQPWRHFESDGEPGVGWWAAGYDDTQSGWASGTTLFDAKRPAGRATVGPGNVAVRTSLNLTNPPGASSITLAYYYRTHFQIPGTLAGTRLQLRTLVDDGAAFYLNGIEVFRLGMPAYPAALVYGTAAARSVSDTQNVFEGPFDLPATNLVDGDNVLAVEVHQRDGSSSDMSFAAQLVGIVPGVYGPPALRMARTNDAMVLSWSNPTARLQYADELSGEWHDVTPPPTNTFLFITDQPARFYRLRVD